MHDSSAQSSANIPTLEGATAKQQELFAQEFSKMPDYAKTIIQHFGIKFSVAEKDKKSDTRFCTFTETPNQKQKNVILFEDIFTAQKDFTAQRALLPPFIFLSGLVAALNLPITTDDIDKALRATKQDVFDVFYDDSLGTCDPRKTAKHWVTEYKKYGPSTKVAVILQIAHHGSQINLCREIYNKYITTAQEVAGRISRGEEPIPPTEPEQKYLRKRNKMAPEDRALDEAKARRAAAALLEVPNEHKAPQEAPHYTLPHLSEQIVNNARSMQPLSTKKAAADSFVEMVEHVIDRIDPADDASKALADLLLSSANLTLVAHVLGLKTIAKNNSSDLPLPSPLKYRKENAQNLSALSKDPSVLSLINDLCADSHDSLFITALLGNIDKCARHARILKGAQENRLQRMARLQDHTAIIYDVKRDLLGSGAAIG